MDSPECGLEVTQSEMGEHFCLKWNNHQENLTGIMAKLLDEQKFVDVSLVCEMKTFKAHQTVLSACSPYFQHVLEENTHPHPIVILRDVKECEMAALLQYMYRGEVNVRDHELSTFLSTARALQIRGLSDGKRDAPSLLEKPETATSAAVQLQAVSPSPPSGASTPQKRRRMSNSANEAAANDRSVIECQQSPSPLPIICKTNSAPKPSSSVSTSSFSDNLSETPYADSSAPASATSAGIKQELDGASTQSEDPFHGLSHHMGPPDSTNRRSREGAGDQRDWNAAATEYNYDSRNFQNQKVELPKVPLPHTQSFSSQLQGPPVPELYPCVIKPKWRREPYRPKEQPGPSFTSQNQHTQPVSVIRNADAPDPVQRKGGRFRPGWMENFSWLQYDEGLNSMFCKTCRKWSSTVPDIRTSFVEGNANFRLEIVNHHDKSKAHRMCMAKEEESIPRLDPIVCDGMR